MILPLAKSARDAESVANLFSDDKTTAPWQDGDVGPESGFHLFSAWG